MTDGRRIRRRRGLIAGGTAIAVTAVAMLGLNLAVAPPAPPQTVSAGAAAAMPADPACTWPVRDDDDADDVSIFLTEDVTEAQRITLHEALAADPLVRNLRYESREEAYQKFAVLWRDSPDFVDAVGVESLPESYRLQLTDRSRFPQLAETYRTRTGVQDLIGRACPGRRR